MRKFLLVLLLAAGSAFAEQKDLQLDAVRAYKAGDYAGAKSLFESVLALDPGNNSAKTYLKMIDAKQKEGSDLMSSLKKIIIPKVDLNDATAQDAFQYVAQRVKAVSNGKTNMNIVWLVPDGADSPVTLSLENMPATEVLKYIAQIAKVKIEYDQLALKVTSATAPAAAPASTP